MSAVSKLRDVVQCEIAAIGCSMSKHTEGSREIFHDCVGPVQNLTEALLMSFRFLLFFYSSRIREFIARAYLFVTKSFLCDTDVNLDSKVYSGTLSC